MVGDEECPWIGREEYVSVQQINLDRDGLAVFSQPSQKLLSNVEGRC
jgi:hypothetical protein